MKFINFLLHYLIDINCKYVAPMLLSLFLMFMSCTLILVLDDYLYQYLLNWRLMALIPIVYLCMYLILRPALFAFKNWTTLISHIWGIFRNEK